MPDDIATPRPLRISGRSWLLWELFACCVLLLGLFVVTLPDPQQEPKLKAQPEGLLAEVPRIGIQTPERTCQERYALPNSLCRRASEKDRSTIIIPLE